MELTELLRVSLPSELGQLRAAPVALGPNEEGILLKWSACAGVDPYHEMFFFPTDTLKLSVMSHDGEILWQRDLGPGVVPGTWFCPVFPFDLDGDRVEEIWFVNNVDPDHPLGVSNYRLERLDALTGETTGQWPWPAYDTDQVISHMFRNFILGGNVDGSPVLLTAQGTYGDMFLQGWDPGHEPRWETVIRHDEPGAEGSHMCPVVDLNGDGRDEVMWGEHCIELDTGEERFCADRETYSGHSDVVQPVLDPDGGRWYLYNCRESDGDVSPRVALFDDRGERVWGAVERGHMDMGWVARLGDDRRPVAMAIRIGHKTAGPGGFAREGIEEFAFDALTGEPLGLPFSTYRTLPVDLNGDGYHELIRGGAAGGEVIDRHGNVLGTVNGHVAMVHKFMDHPGEQALVHRPDGTVSVYADADAEDGRFARKRYANPFYTANRRLGAVGYNPHVLGGL